MTRLKHAALATLVVLSVLSLSELGAMLTGRAELSFAPRAEAVVGRPLTPVSVAGAARRTVRRCAVGVYYC